MRFRVEYIGLFHGIAHVIAHQIDPGDFVIGDSASLDSTPIHRWLSQPRTLKPDGDADLEIFTFALRSAEDARNLAIGQTVQLTNAGNGNEAT